MLKERNEHQNSHFQEAKQTDRVAIVFYTDPLCCWSWALLPHLQRLRTEYEGQLSLNYCMGGLISDWKSYSDPLNSVNRPSQMGPLWMDAGRKTGAVINDALWMEDPPSSSFPACIAVKTAELQSYEAGEAFLKELMNAAMVEGRNPSRDEVIVDVAGRLASTQAQSFSLDHFISHYNKEESRNAFRSDLQKVRYHKIGRFPTVTMVRKDVPGVIFTGYRPYEALLEVFSQVQNSSL